MNNQTLEESKKYPIGGYAPGNYMCNCVTCKQQFIGDKRAVQCESCAIEMVNIKVEINNNNGIQIDKQETLEESIYQAIGLAANEQGIINQALATSNVMNMLEKQICNKEQVFTIQEISDLFIPFGKNGYFDEYLDFKLGLDICVQGEENKLKWENEVESRKITFKDWYEQFKKNK